MAGTESVPPHSQREKEYHEGLYSGAAQQHLAGCALRAFRAHLARRIQMATGAGPRSRVLSIGCGIGDTEMLLAPRVGEVVGIDLAGAGVRQARESAARLGIRNARFFEGSFEAVAEQAGRFDLAIAIYLLHRLSERALAEFPARLSCLLAPGGAFYSLDPSRYRLADAARKLAGAGAIEDPCGPGRRQMAAHDAIRLFESRGFQARTRFYDFLSTPLAAAHPGAATVYRLARALDEVLIRLPGVREFGCSFELVARPR
jgi:SAM-dependent methyltransferase